ncbi:MAG: peptidoglycan editing factor PgeF [Pseudomonadales bacterium]|nr:peptidoglycan editing factor PgeF [Pseudomonadales bacterium]
MTQLKRITPDWPAPGNVGTIVTTRMGGVSSDPFDSLNLALHVEDDPVAVKKNRQLVASDNAEQLDWQWLNQVHGSQVHTLSATQDALTGDGLATGTPGLVCCVMTADCLPVLFCNKEGTEVAIAHGGWRGLADSILTRTQTAMQSAPDSLLAWLGPAIGPENFEVGMEVRERFLSQDDSKEMASNFAPVAEGKYLANLYGIARRQLRLLGIDQVYGGSYCTFRDADLFFSYRRDGVTGRQLSAIYLRP